ncbi:MAG TPA: glycosyltransferase [Acetobacteraceae bacterium]|nr:glycosyltransferase [Acetobacteraceae bacterium]
MRLAFYGSSLLSSYWNGAATYYRGVLEPLSQRGWDITFYEPDAFDRQAHRDIDPPPWAQVVVYPATEQGVRRVVAQAAAAEVVVKASGVGVFDDALLAGVISAPRVDALRVFWDVDAPATIAEMRDDPQHPVRRSLSSIDMVLTYGGGEPVVDAYTELGAVSCVPVYNALDPETHYPVTADPALRADLSFLANRMPDREVRAREFFFRAAELLPDRRFLLGGWGGDASVSGNVHRLGHVGTDRHNAFNCSALAVLNVARESMAAMGFCPATRVFEAAGAGACVITDSWYGIELFLAPDKEVLVARDGRDVAAHLAALTPTRAEQIGRRGRERVLANHTYSGRAGQVDVLFRAALARKRATALT